MTILWALLLTICAAAACVVLDAARRRKRSAMFRERPPLDASQIWRSFYVESDISLGEFTDAWLAICRRADVDPTRLRPDDALSVIARADPGSGVGDEWDDVVEEWVLRAHAAAATADCTALSDVDSVVRLSVRVRREERRYGHAANK